MKRWAASRRWMCAGLAQVLLFAQLATAAHACPVVAGAPAHWPAGGVVASVHAGCHGDAVTGPSEGVAGDAAAGEVVVAQADRGALCQAHCQGQAQSGASELPAQVAAFMPLLVAVLDWRPAAHAEPVPLGRGAPAQSGAPPPGSPPIYLALQVLRN